MERTFTAFTSVALVLAVKVFVVLFQVPSVTALPAGPVVVTLMEVPRALFALATADAAAEARVIPALVPSSFWVPARAALSVPA